MKMFKKSLVLLFVLLPLSVMAQYKFGYLSYSAVYQAMPEYSITQERMADLKAKYDAETQRAEEEFQKKFGEFIQGQKDFPANILLKRQGELQELMEKSLAFKIEARKALEQAEKELQAPVLDKLNRLIEEVGREHGYAYILNIDSNACPYIHPEIGEDATLFVITKLE